MNRFFLQRRGYRILLSVFLMAGLLMAFAPDSNAQNRPNIPILSLTGSQTSYDQNWYPDGRITTSPSRDISNPKILLVPVFIDNRWATYDDHPEFQADPIKSFKFTVLYDSTYLRAVGYQKSHPETTPDDPRFGYDFMTGERIEPLAKNFNITWHDEKNDEYKEIFEPDYTYSPNEKRRGRGMTITGSSSIPLPNTDLNAAGDFQILIYLRFEIRTETSALTPIMIWDESIMYNDLDVRKEAPFEELRGYIPEVEEKYSDPKRFTGMAGMNNFTTDKFNYMPHYPGMIYCNITQQLPEFEFDIESYTTSVPPLREENDGLYVIVDPLTIDSTDMLPNYATADVKVSNAIEETRLTDVRIESDSKWLKFHTYPQGGARSPCSGLTKDCYINWIDNGIIDRAGGDPMENELDAEDEIYVRITCDPDELEKDGEKAGVYVGHLIFSSPDAEYNPVRLKVTFIYFRIPYDGIAYEEPGINLDLKNDAGDELNLIFGVGHRATNGVDRVYGEYEYGFPLATQEFDARWYPMDEDGNELTPFGLGDFAANHLETRSNSRDIRNYYSNKQSITYLCKFNPVKYPITIEWDIRDFTIELPNGNTEEPTLFIRDVIGGVPQQGINMRQATKIGDTRYSYTIQDPRVTSFIIEYTLPQVVEYVDEDGNPIIKDGWNLLSMPVLPVNTQWDNVYPLSTNKPWRFYNNNYQQEEVLKAGVGYFVKYDDYVDTQFKGTFMREISQDFGFSVRLTEGWNTMGALSVPLSVYDIDFDFFQNNRPDLAVALEKGIYEYRTDKGYFEVSELLPGLGYWIFANNQGYLRLVSQKLNTSSERPNIEKEAVLNQSIKLNINDNAQHRKALYLTNNDNVNFASFEYPPTPPQELFDARFSNNGYLDLADATTIVLQGVEYPLSINMPNPDGEYTFADAVTGEIFGTIEAKGNNTIEIEKVESNRIKVEKADVDGFAISAYPNPASTTANVEFTVPFEGNVNITLYDALGNKVETVFNGSVDAGTHTANISAAELAAGSYLCRITAGEHTAVTKITIIK